jgi:hypothetical protein
VPATPRYAYFQCLGSEYQAACRTTLVGRQLAFEVTGAFDYIFGQFLRAWAHLHTGQWRKLLKALTEAIETAEKNAHQLWAVLFRLELACLYEQTFNYATAASLCRQRGGSSIRPAILASLEGVTARTDEALCEHKRIKWKP